MDITDNEFECIVKYMKKNYGINLSSKRVLIKGRLENFLIKNGYKSYNEYMEKVEKDKNGPEAKNLINALTTNHTYFLREPLHFNYMRDIILPHLVQQESRSKSLRIWCAASSTGEEPYTIAMVLKDYFKLQAGSWDTRILATDISTRALEKAMEGVYLDEQIQGLPPNWIKSYFKVLPDGQYKINDAIKNEVIFRRLNLMDSFSFKGKFHLIFLRNVMIYFEDDTKTRLIDKMYEYMENGAYLFTGLTEVLDKKNTKLKYIQPSIYRKM